MRGRANAVAIVALLAVGCSVADPEERYDTGAGDGYAVGYNTACEIRATLIEGDFDDQDYARGYAEGMEDGIADCNADRRSGNVR
jgi:hypothetical protein